MLQTAPFAIPRPNSRKRKLVNSNNANASLTKSEYSPEDEEVEELRYEGDSGEPDRPGCQLLQGFVY